MTNALVLSDDAGTELAELEVFHTFRYEVSKAASVKFLLGYDQLGATNLLSTLVHGIPALVAYRNSNPILYGFWQPHQETLDYSEQEGIACEFRSPVARLETRFRTSARTFTGIDSGLIAWGLIQDTNAVGATGITQGSFQSAVHRNRTYEAGKSLAEAIGEFTDADDFQFTETPYTIGSALNIWTSMDTVGRDISSDARFEFGEDTINNVQSFERAISFPTNKVVLTGGPSGTPIVSVADDLASQSRYGVYMASEQTQMTDATRMDEKAQSMLRSDPVQQITFVPDVKNCPQPFTDYDLGDIISFYVRKDDLEIQAFSSITAFEIDRNADGEEIAHRIEFGDQTVWPLEWVRHGTRIRVRHHTRLAGFGSLTWGGVGASGKSWMLSGNNRISGLKPSVGRARSGNKYRRPRGTVGP